MFQAFQYKEFQFIFQDDPSTKISKVIYKNISKSRLHREVSKTPILPSPDVIKCMTWRIDHESRTILNFKDKHVASYQAPMLNQLYQFKEAQVRVTPKWLESKNESIDFIFIMKGWWSEGNCRSNPTPIGWGTSKLRKRIQIMVIFMSRIF